MTDKDFIVFTITKIQYRGTFVLGIEVSSEDMFYIRKILQGLHW